MSCKRKMCSSEVFHACIASIRGIPRMSSKQARALCARIEAIERCPHLERARGEGGGGDVMQGRKRRRPRGSKRNL